MSNKAEFKVGDYAICTTPYLKELTNNYQYLIIDIPKTFKGDYIKVVDNNNYAQVFHKSIFKPMPKPKEKEIWIVVRFSSDYRPYNYVPHYTEKSAQTEAERLSKLNPNSKFGVYKLEGVVETTQVTTTETKWK